jgi:hypothetical protein
MRLTNIDPAKELKRKKKLEKIMEKKAEKDKVASYLCIP